MSKVESKKNPFEAARIIKTEAPQQPDSIPVDDQMISFVTKSVDPIPLPIEEEIVEDQEIPAQEEESVEETEVVPEEDDSSEPNPYEHLANQLKSDGFLDDMEIKKDISAKDVYEAYTSKLRKEIEPRVVQEVHEKIQELGANEQDLVIAMLLRKGVDVYSLQNEGIAYEQLSAFNKESSKENKILNIKKMHYAKGYSDEESDVLINNAGDDEKLDTLYGSSTKFFGERHKEWINNKANEVLAKENRNKEVLERNVNLIRSKLNSLELLGDKLDKQTAKELESHIFNKDDFYETEDGRKVPATKFEKFFYKLMEDPELKIWTYKKYLKREDEVKNLEKKIEKEKEQEFLASYKRSVTKNVKNTSSKNTVLPAKNSRTFMVEL